jgi:hypothetical protein
MLDSPDIGSTSFQSSGIRAQIPASRRKQFSLHAWIFANQPEELLKKQEQISKLMSREWLIVMAAAAMYRAAMCTGPKASNLLD